MGSLLQKIMGTENFQELDHRDKVFMKELDIIAYQKSVERLRLHIFLASLDDMFEQVHDEICTNNKSQIRKNIMQKFREKRHGK